MWGRNRGGGLCAGKDAWHRELKTLSLTLHKASNKLDQPPTHKAFKDLVSMVFPMLAQI